MKYIIFDNKMILITSIIPALILPHYIEIQCDLNQRESFVLGPNIVLSPISLGYWPYGTTLNQIDTLVLSGTPIVSMPILITKNF